MASKNPSQTSMVQDTQPSPCFPSRKPTYEDLKASTANSELHLKKQHTTSQDKVKTPGSSERIQPGPGLVKMASQIQIGELGQADAKSNQQARYGKLQDEQLNHQARSARQDTRSANFQETAQDRAAGQRQERAAADQQSENAPLNNHQYLGQVPYHPFMHQQILMQQQQLLLQMQGQLGGVNGMPDQGVGVTPASLMAHQNMLQQYAQFVPRQIPLVSGPGTQHANGDDYNVTSMSPLLPPGQSFFPSNLLTPRSPLVPPIDAQNQMNTDQILKQIESYKEMLHEFLKMDQFQSQGTYSKSIFSGVEDEGEISYTATVSPAGQSVQNGSIFNASSGAASSKARTQIQAQHLAAARDVVAEVFAAAIDDNIEEEKLEEMRKAEQKVEEKVDKVVPPEMQREAFLKLVETKEAAGQDQIEEAFAQIAAPGSAQISVLGLAGLLQAGEGRVLAAADVNRIALQVNENATSESITLQTFSRMVSLLHELYLERTQPRVSVAPDERAEIREEAQPPKVDTARKQELVAQSNVNQIQIEAQNSQTRREPEQITERKQNQVETQTSEQRLPSKEEKAEEVVVDQENDVQLAVEVQRKEKGANQRSSLDIDASEFIMAMISEESLLTMPRMKLAFEILDTEYSKLIDIEKMRSILVNAIRRSSDCPISEESIEEALLHCDKNKDNMIQFSEFCNLLLRLHVIFAIETSRVEQIHAEEEMNLKAQQRVQCRQLLSRLIFDNTVLEIEENQIKQIYDQLHSEANEQIINKEYSSDLDLFELKQLKFILCNRGRLQESDIDQTAQDVFQGSVRSTIAMEEFLEIILKLKAICLSRSHMEEGQVVSQDREEEVLELPDNPADATIQRLNQFKQAYQFQYSTNRASVEEAHCEFDINIQDGESPVDEEQPASVEEGSKSVRDEQLDTSHQSNKKVTIMKKKKQSGEVEKRRGEAERTVPDASSKVQPDVMIKTKKRNSSSKVMLSTETRGPREGSAAKPRDSQTRFRTQQLQQDATVAKDQQLTLPPLQFKKEPSLLSKSYGFSSQNDKDSVSARQAAEPKVEKEPVQKVNNPPEQQKPAPVQDKDIAPPVAKQAPAPVPNEQAKEADQGKQKKKVKIHELIQKHESQKIPNEDNKEEWSEQGSEHFAKLKRIQTMPVRSVLPEDINFDEVESCRISGMSNTRTPGREHEEKAQQDVLYPNETPQQIELELELAHGVGKDARSPPSRLPPRVPAQPALANNSLNNEKSAGVPLPTITPKRDVLMNSVISRPSEKYWANFSYGSNERRELEKLIGFNQRSSANSQLKHTTQDARSKDDKSPFIVNSNGSMSNNLFLNRDDSELMHDVKVFLHHSQNGSDCIIFNKETGDVVDVLTQEKMFTLLKEKKAELEQLEALANSQRMQRANMMGQYNEVASANGGGVQAVGPDEHTEPMGTLIAERSLNYASQEVMDSASYRSSGILRSMSATNMSMPFLDKVQVGAKESKEKRRAFELDFNNLTSNYDKEQNVQRQAQQISHQRLASTRTEIKKASRELLPPMGQGQPAKNLHINQEIVSDRQPQSVRSQHLQQTNMAAAHHSMSRLDQKMQENSGTPQVVYEESSKQAALGTQAAKSPAQDRVTTALQQDVGMLRAPDSIHSEEQLNRWPQELHKLNSTDMILSKDFKLKESLDNMNQISKKIGQVHNEIMSKRERQKKLHVDQMLLEEQAVEQQMQARPPPQPVPSNTRLASAPYSSPSDFRFRVPEPLSLQQNQQRVAHQLTGNNFHYSGNFAPRPFEESLVMNTDRRGEPPSRMSYDEVPLEEYFSNRVGGKNLMSNAQVYARFKGFNKQAELEEEQHRQKRDGLSLQQQNQDYNMKRNESFVRRLNDDFYRQNAGNANQGHDELDVYHEFGDLRQIHRERNDLPNILSAAAQERQMQQFRIGMFDDVKPMQVAVHHGLPSHDQMAMYPHEFSSQEPHPVGGTVNSMIGPAPTAPYQHQSGMKAISGSNSLTMSLRHQQQASNRPGHERHQQDYINKLVGQGQIIRQHNYSSHNVDY